MQLAISLPMAESLWLLVFRDVGGRKMIESWRWYGPSDKVTPDDIAQAGARHVVTALHHVPNGEVWTLEEIEKRQRMLAAKGLLWSVVESLPVHEDIKTRTGGYRGYIDNYCQSLRNLAARGIALVCYNFMPVLDWTRTNLEYVLPNGAKALRFDHIDLAAFDLHILQREHAAGNYSAREIALAAQRHAAMGEEERERLTRNILMGLPGAQEHYTLEEFRAHLGRYDGLDAVALRQNLSAFLQAIIPTAETAGVRMAIHPDDPPRSILGLPRVMSTQSDMDALREALPNRANGFTFCTGSYGVRADNALPEMFAKHAERIYFAHFRSTRRDRENPHSFTEAEHLGGDVDMYAMMKSLLTEERRRGEEIPVRPDHGHQILDDLDKTQSNPGYTAIGRLKGLAELRGLALGIQRSCPALRPRSEGKP